MWPISDMMLRYLSNHRKYEKKKLGGNAEGGITGDSTGPGNGSGAVSVPPNTAGEDGDDGDVDLSD
jgi:hypothetical protein